MSIWRVVSGFILAACCAGPAAAAHTLLPAPSTWTLDAAKSDFSGIPGMKHDVWHILIDTEQRFKYTDTMTLDNGQVVRNSWDGPQDGSLRASPGWPGVKMGFDLATDTAHMESSDGTSMEGHLSVTPDGRTMTIKMDVHAKDGSIAHQTLVYERTK